MEDDQNVRPGAEHATDRFGLLFILLLVLFALTAFAQSSNLVRVATGLLVLAIVTTTLRVTGTTPRRLRVAQLLAGAFGLTVVAGGFLDDSVISAAFGIIFGLLLGVGPLMLVRRIFEHDEVTVPLIIAALAAYLQVALVFAFIYAGLIDASSEPFFNQDGAGVQDVLYFSVVTITTLGYGDLTPATDAGQALAMIETLFGQIFLVVLVAYLVGSLGSQRKRLRKN